MSKAYLATEKHPITAAEVSWKTVPVALPASQHMNEESLLAELKDPKVDAPRRTHAAKELIWLRRCMSGDTVDITCLTLGPARILNMPGELAVEYQLAAQKMHTDLFVAMAAYGELAPGYICMKEHYRQGGYEDSPRASRVSPEVEEVLMTAMEELLQ